MDALAALDALDALAAPDAVAADPGAAVPVRGGVARSSRAPTRPADEATPGAADAAALAVVPPPANPEIVPPPANPEIVRPPADPDSGQAAVGATTDRAMDATPAAAEPPSALRQDSGPPAMETPTRRGADAPAPHRDATAAIDPTPTPADATPDAKIAATHAPIPVAQAAVPPASMPATMPVAMPAVMPVAQATAPPPAHAAAPPAATTVADVPQPALGAAVGRLRSHGDGTHELTVALHPAELGSVGVTATVRDGAITVSVACAQAGAHAAVDASLPSLRHELAQAGFSAVDVTVTGDGRNGATNPRRDELPTPAAQRADTDAEPERPLRRFVRSTALDRLL